MPWEDAVSAIGPALQAGFGTYQWMEGQKRQEEQDAWAQQKHALDQQFKREDLAQEKEIANLKMAHSMVMQGIKASTAIELLNLGNISKEKIAELVASEKRYQTESTERWQTGRTDATERWQTGRTGAMVDIGKGHDAASMFGATTRANASMYGADQGLLGRQYASDTTAGTAEAERQSRNWRADIEHRRRLENDRLDFLHGGRGRGGGSPLFEIPAAGAPAGGAPTPVAPAAAPSGAPPYTPPPPPPPGPSPRGAAGTPTGAPPPAISAPQPAPSAPPAARSGAGAPMAPSVTTQTAVAPKGAPPPVVSPVEAAGRQIQVLLGQMKAADARGDHNEVARLQREMARIRASVGR